MRQRHSGYRGVEIAVTCIAPPWREPTFADVPPRSNWTLVHSRTCSSDGEPKTKVQHRSPTTSSRLGYQSSRRVRREITTASGQATERSVASTGRKGQDDAGSALPVRHTHAGDPI